MPVFNKFHRYVAVYLASKNEKIWNAFFSYCVHSWRMENVISLFRKRFRLQTGVIELRQTKAKYDPYH